ncbi:putative ATP-grasp superfamily ATP-dependent carboligase [Granulicella aggregans]|uniref:Putative ATP-grasp superfamily ATP-dependent carboligase n=1 Tax=Granulicella aggregans TaxID=474949 RepID=A0A7W8E2J6_9BACT|nr:ATP-grasp domain-containing protein [Granulicella aggregans]MBB5056943.1 putative ATP-grasp superfamily ATP-dependent carboligase [Granulicella aggregans]
MLLATAGSGGTLAAVRQLARCGTKAAVISSEPLAAAAWSKYAFRKFKGPQEKDSQKFLEFLMKIGSASPDRVLLPTSDETAWLYTSNAPLLKKYFRLHQPSVQTMQRLLDKKLLSDAALTAGLQVLPTWEPRTMDEVIDSAPTLQYPILIKPRTQVHRANNDKGMVADSPSDLVEKYHAFMSREYPEALDVNLPDANIPLLQHFVNIGAKGVHSVSGFIDESGELFVSRHARKVFQRSMPAGVGVCFEALPANPSLSNCVRRLCKELGYFGIFEVEFISFGDGWAVIDFNPRLFNQVGMDSYRGMPLPLMAYLDAAGRTAELREVVEKAQKDDHNRPAVFYDRFTLWAILTAKALTGRAEPGEREYWREWKRRNRADTVYFAADVSDPMPGIVHALSEIFLGVKAARRFLRSTEREVTEVDPLIPTVPA